MQSRTAMALAVCAVLAGCASSGSMQSASSVARTESCKATSEQEIAALFDRWNQSLLTNDAHQVVANYAERSILLPTASNKPRLTAEEKEEYFHHFLENRPSGKIDLRSVEIGCNTAVDAGLYTFTFAKTGAALSARYTYTYRWDGAKWRITSHHSSYLPERN
ncbi:MAG: SgcJ/EcaC family oxidoreductase [Burkholderiaceae bacterium]